MALIASSSEAAPATVDDVKIGAGMHGRSSLGMVLFLTLLATLATVDRNVIALLIEPIKADLRIDDVEASLLFGLAFALIYTLASIPAGWAADRWSRRNIISSTTGLWCVGTVLCGISPGYGMLFASRFATGLTESFLNPASQSLIRDRVAPAWRGRAFSALAAAPILGAGAAVLLGGTLLHALPRDGLTFPLLGHLRPWQAIMVILGMAGLPLSLMAMMLGEPRRLRNTVVKPTGSWPLAIDRIRRAPRLYGALFVFIVCQTLVAAAYGAWLPSLLIRSYGLKPIEIGLTMGTLFLVVTPVGALLSGLALDHFQSRQGHRSLPKAALAVVAASGITSILAPMSPSAFWLFALVAIQVPMHVMPAAIVSVALSRITPSNILGRIIGVQFLLTGIFGSTLGPIFTALLTQHVFAGPGAIGFALSTVCVIATLLSVAAAIVMRKPYVATETTD